MPLATAATYPVVLRSQHSDFTQHLGQRRPVQCTSGTFTRCLPSAAKTRSAKQLPICSGSRRVQGDLLKYRCYCLSSKDTQPQMKRQTVKQAIQSALRDEKPYLLKLLLASIAGAATVKFGSLAIDTPFHPSLFTAVGIITLPCLAFSMILWRLPD